MPKIGLNFKFQSPTPNFERDRYDTIEDLKGVTLEDLDIGHIVYCVENNKHYVFTDTATITLGYFKEFENESFPMSTLDINEAIDRIEHPENYE